MEPVVRVLRDTNTVGLIQSARPEWIKFEAGGTRAVQDEDERVKDERYIRLHLDHVPVIKEDMAIEKTTFALFFGNRGFFPASLQAIGYLGHRHHTSATTGHVAASVREAFERYLGCEVAFL